VALLAGSNVATVRTVLAQQAQFRRGAVMLVGVAGQQSLSETPAPLPVDTQIDEPLWPALAATSRASPLRRIASCSTTSRHPRERKKALGWGLEFTVGGTTGISTAAKSASMRSSLVCRTWTTWSPKPASTEDTGPRKADCGFLAADAEKSPGR
jgi:hypothetical protein